MKLSFYKKSYLQITTIVLLAFFIPSFAGAQYFGLGGGGPDNFGGTNYSGGQYWGDIQNDGGLIHGSGLPNSGGTQYNPSSFSQNNATSQNTATSIGNSQGGVLYSSGNNQGSACNANLVTFGDVFYFLACVMNNYMVGIAVTLATIYTIWGIIQYIIEPDSVEERKKSRQAIIWGVVTLFIIISVWGIVQFFRSTLGV